jgi:hypothetical protein
MAADRSLGEIEFERGGQTLVAALYLDGWVCRTSAGEEDPDVLLEVQSLLDEKLDPVGQCLTAHPAFQVEMLERAATLLGGRVSHRPQVGSLPRGAIG